MQRLYILDPIHNISAAVERSLDEGWDYRLTWNANRQTIWLKDSGQWASTQIHKDSPQKTENKAR